MIDKIKLNESMPLRPKTAVMTKTDWAIHRINQMDYVIKNVCEWKLWAITIGLVMRVLWILPAASVWVASRINSHTIELTDTNEENLRVNTWGGWGPTIQFHPSYSITPGNNGSVVHVKERKYTVWTDRMLGEEAYYSDNHW